MIIIIKPCIHVYYILCIIALFEILDLSLNYEPFRREFMNTNTTVVTILSSYYCDFVLFFKCLSALTSYLYVTIIENVHIFYLHSYIFHVYSYKYTKCVRYIQVHTKSFEFQITKILMMTYCIISFPV